MVLFNFYDSLLTWEDAFFKLYGFDLLKCRLSQDLRVSLLEAKNKTIKVISFIFWFCEIFALPQNKRENISREKLILMRVDATQTRFEGRSFQFSASINRKINCGIHALILEQVFFCLCEPFNDAFVQNKFARNFADFFFHSCTEFKNNFGFVYFASVSWYLWCLKYARVVRGEGGISLIQRCLWVTRSLLETRDSTINSPWIKRWSRSVTEGNKNKWNVPASEV